MCFGQFSVFSWKMRFVQRNLLLWSSFLCSVKVLLKFTASQTVHCFEFVANLEACRVDSVTLFLGLAGEKSAQNLWPSQASL